MCVCVNNKNATEMKGQDWHLSGMLPCMMHESNDVALCILHPNPSCL